MIGRSSRLVYELEVFLEYGAGVYPWVSSEEDASKWGGNPIDLEDLPISASLRDELERVGDWYNKSLNWEYPPDPGPWRQAECDQFNRAARAAVRRLGEELGPDWSVGGYFSDMVEDPELDRYLADPRNFRRHR